MKSIRLLQIVFITFVLFVSCATQDEAVYDPMVLTENLLVDLTKIPMDNFITLEGDKYDTSVMNDKYIITLSAFKFYNRTRWKSDNKNPMVYQMGR
ncbi:MAG: hypothetical protein LBM77_08670 [Spirochaetaceae bacterium]|jgi:hypothetical protein|nr:hypothetical protein [Spirochaetaceae bacterium]